MAEQENARGNARRLSVEELEDVEVQKGQERQMSQQSAAKRDSRRRESTISAEKETREF